MNGVMADYKIYLTEENVAGCAAATEWSVDQLLKVIGIDPEAKWKIVIGIRREEGDLNVLVHDDPR